MPKLISPAMQAHLQQPVTSMALCWLIVRLDGQAFGFTQLDTDLIITDGLLPVPSLTYKSSGGFSASALVNHTSGAVDNQEVIGYFSPTGILAQDLENGKFDFASIYLFAVNWADLSMGIVPLKRGYFGECTLTPAGVFTGELRGMTQLLVQEFGNTYQPICRADLGDLDCKIPIVPATWQPNTAYAVGDFIGPLAIINTSQGLSMWKATTGGTSGSTEPSWNYSPTPTPDGSVVWVGQLGYRNLGNIVALDGPTSASFITSALSLPGATLGNTATITIIGNITAGTSLEITDGAGGVFSFTAPFDVSAQTYFDNLVIALGSATVNITFNTATNLNIGLTNNTGVQGSITKSGDLVPGIRIAQFAAGYLDAGTLKWITGNNAGVAMEIKTFDQNNSRVILWLTASFPMQVGDQFMYYAGCDKRRDTCFLKFSNVLNFRGEPDMPGVNRMLQFADAT